MKKAKQIIAIVLIVLAVVIAFLNMTPVKTNLLFAEIEMPRIVMLLSVFVLGFAAGKLIKFRKK